MQSEGDEERAQAVDIGGAYESGSGKEISEIEGSGMNDVVKAEKGGTLALSEGELIKVLQSSLYPGAAVESVKMVLSYCKAAGLDPIQKPVHIVPMWDSKAGAMRDVVMPGIGLYRTQSARSNECAGVSEPEFGPDVEGEIGGQKITFPAWCRVSVKRRLPTGEIAEYTAKEFWKENYAVKGGKEKSIAPNAMWTKRPYGQIAKCAEAQALRKAFPELGSQPTAEEMEGKVIDVTGTVVDETSNEELRNKWISSAKASHDEKTLQTVWSQGVKEFKEADDITGANMFKSAVQERRDALKTQATKPEDTKQQNNSPVIDESDIPY